MTSLSRKPEENNTVIIQEQRTLCHILQLVSLPRACAFTFSHFTPCTLQTDISRRLSYRLFSREIPRRISFGHFRPFQHSNVFGIFLRDAFIHG